MVAREMRIILNLIYLQVLFNVVGSELLSQQSRIAFAADDQCEEHDPDFVQSLGRGR